MKRPDLIADPVGPTLIRLVLPMIAGALDLAAMNYTFPIAIVAGSIASGIGVGAHPETMGLIRDYMVVWYIGMPFVMLPMTGQVIFVGISAVLTNLAPPIAGLPGLFTGLAVGKSVAGGAAYLWFQRASHAMVAASIPTGAAVSRPGIAAAETEAVTAADAVAEELACE